MQNANLRPNTGMKILKFGAILAAKLRSAATIGAVMAAGLGLSAAATIGAQAWHTEHTGYAWEDAVLLDVVDINITEMRRQRMSGAEAVLKTMEQFIDFTYRFIYISDNRYTPEKKMDFLKAGKNRMIVGVVGFPEQNHVIMAQVLFDRSYFLVIASKQASDVPVGSAMPMVRMNYEKYNSMRRNNVKEFIQRNNIEKMGVGSNEQ